MKIASRALALLLFLAPGSPPARAQEEQLPGSSIPQFVDPLPRLAADGGSIATVIAGVDEIELHMREFRANMMPSTFEPEDGAYDGTWVWGYVVGPDLPVSPVDTFTGPVVVATRGMPAQFRFVNDLGFAAETNVLAWYYASDPTLHWADPLGGGMNACAEYARENPGMPPVGDCAEHYDGPIPAVVHLHGGDVPPVLDGGPDAWFTSDGAYHGPSYYTRPGFPVAGNAAVYRYPNVQEAAPIWFHDHALGVTRLNVYAGLAGAYAIVDPELVLPAGLHPLGLQQGSDGEVEYLIPLVIQDRMFDENGQLYFPNEGDNPEHPFWLPEFVGDVITVNGKVWPYLDVQPKRQRFLIVNGSNARTYALFVTPGALGGAAVPLGPAPGATSGGTAGRMELASAMAGPTIWQIGTDGGYLDAPAAIDMHRRQKLVLMPGERADVIIDFAAFAGETLLLRNTAKTPYPAGEPADGHTVGRILQFRVQSGTPMDLSYDPSGGTPLRSGDQRIVRLVDPLAGTLAPGVTVAATRQLTLNEVDGTSGPLEAIVNNTIWDGVDRPDFTPITIGGMTAYYSELPHEGTTEVWEIVNLTADAHPIHLHLAQFQLLNRQRIRTGPYVEAYEESFPGGEYVPGDGPPLDYATGNPRALGGNPDVTPFLQGPAHPPRAHEAGWKDTVLVPPGAVTRFVVRWAPQDEPVTAPDPHYGFDPSALGRGYVWHCHIIDHEDNEMMRPLSVVPKPGAVRTYVLGEDY